MNFHSSSISEEDTIKGKRLEYPTRRRKSSEISDFYYTDSDDGSSQDSLDSSEIAELSENDSEVEIRRTPSNYCAPPTSGLLKVSRPKNSRSRAFSNLSDVDELPDCAPGISRAKIKTNKTNNDGEGVKGERTSTHILKRWHRRKRAGRRYSVTSESSSDLGISTSDIDENLPKSGEIK
ncbi:unnamed protein product [Rodentolepis nana]|uniref:Uncharacterized protein n=1 Tax=Rodentolepis nana TaxID=102285 RepID=A0A0R3TFY3_RODNA|nr:unnamed protein product [Rodentolepis nana]